MPAGCCSRSREPRQQIERPLAILANRRAVVPGVSAHLQVLFDRQVGEDPAALGHLHQAAGTRCDAAASRRSTRRRTRCVPSLRPQQSGDRAERRRLSRPIAADQRHDFALLDAQRDAVQRLNRTVADAQVFDGQERHRVMKRQIYFDWLATAQIGGNHFRIILNFRRRAVGDHHAVVEHGDPLADLHHQAHVVVDQQDRHAEIDREFRESTRPARAFRASSSPAAGSSSNSTFGSVASARTISKCR